MKKFKEHLVELENILISKKKIKTPEELEDFSKFIKSAYRISKKIYPQEIDDIFTFYNIDYKMNHIKNKVDMLCECFEHFSIEEGKIKIKSNNNIVEFPIYDINSFLKDIFEIKKENIIFYLCMGFCLDEENFNNIQLYSLSMYIKPL